PPRDRPRPAHARVARAPARLHAVRSAPRRADPPGRRGPAVGPAPPRIRPDAPTGRLPRMGDRPDRRDRPRWALGNAVGDGVLPFRERSGAPPGLARPSATAPMTGPAARGSRMSAQPQMLANHRRAFLWSIVLLAGCVAALFVVGRQPPEAAPLTTVRFVGRFDTT